MTMKTESTVIKGIQYTVTQLNAEKALEMQLHLLNLAGGDIAKLFSDTSKIADLLKGLEPAKVIELIKKFVISPSVLKKEGDENKIVDINRDFSGDLVGLYTLFYFVLEVNYKDFFLEALPKVMPLLESFFTWVVAALASNKES